MSLLLTSALQYRELSVHEDKQMPINMFTYKNYHYGREHDSK